MLFDTASLPRGGIALPLAHGYDDVALIHYGKGSAEDAGATPLRASALPPHRFADVGDGDDGDGDVGDLRRSTSSSSASPPCASAL